MRQGRRWRLVAGLIALAAVAAACGSPSSKPSSTSAATTGTRGSEAAAAFHGTLLTPPIARPDQWLRDTTGRWFSLAHRPDGEVTVLFFGFTHCPDVCPTTMADLSVARGQLQPAARRHVKVVFVTEDPQRDTPTVLRRWLDRFDPSFVGLLGGNAKTTAMLSQLHLPQTERLESPRTPVRHPETHGNHHEQDYSIGHAGEVYAFGPDGESVLYTGGTTPSQYAQDFTRLTRGSVGDSAQ
jgi:protein SCO1